MFSVRGFDRALYTVAAYSMSNAAIGVYSPLCYRRVGVRAMYKSLIFSVALCEVE